MKYKEYRPYDTLSIFSRIGVPLSPSYLSHSDQDCTSKRQEVQHLTFIPLYKKMCTPNCVTLIIQKVFFYEKGVILSDRG